LGLTGRARRGEEGLEIARQVRGVGSGGALGGEVGQGVQALADPVGGAARSVAAGERGGPEAVEELRRAGAV
jgi:hypothetical protein